MRAFLKYLLIAFVFASYLQAVLEINNDYIANTWGDECDIYVHSENIFSSTIIKAEHQTDFALLPQITFDLQTPALNFFSNHFADKIESTFEQKRFLKNRSLLI